MCCNGYCITILTHWDDDGVYKSIKQESYYIICKYFNQYKTCWFDSNFYLFRSESTPTLQFAHVGALSTPHILSVSRIFQLVPHRKINLFQDRIQKYMKKVHMVKNGGILYQPLPHHNYAVVFWFRLKFSSQYM